MKRHHPFWPRVGVWEGRWAMLRYLIKRRRWPRGYVIRTGMHLTADQRFRGRARPTNYIRSSRRDQREMDAYNRATGADKSLADYFDGLKDVPKGPVRQRKGHSPF